LFLLDRALHEVGQPNGLAHHYPPMPLPQRDWDNYTENIFLAEQLNYDQGHEREEVDRRIPQLNSKQREAYEQILSSFTRRDGRLFFLHGPGGTGKTFVYQTLCHHVRSEGQIVLCVASSGIAALLLPGGRTSYSTFQIPVENLYDQSSCPIKKEGPRAQMLRRFVLII
ncbi:PIF1-like helicase-domain-containing protein, partial [Amylostereum chailletii]